MRNVSYHFTPKIESRQISCNTTAKKPNSAADSAAVGSTDNSDQPISFGYTPDICTCSRKTASLNINKLQDSSQTLV